MSVTIRIVLLAVYLILFVGCAPEPQWHLKLAHSEDGEVQSGSKAELIGAIRNGCQVRVAWGARRAADPNMTIEHIAIPGWISVRNSNDVEVQLDGFMSNLAVLGEPPEDHPRRERFGGTEKAVSWRANLNLSSLLVSKPALQEEPWLPEIWRLQNAVLGSKPDHIAFQP